MISSHVSGKRANAFSSTVHLFPNVARKWAIDLRHIINYYQCNLNFDTYLEHSDSGALQKYPVCALIYGQENDLYVHSMLICYVK